MRKPELFSFKCWVCGAKTKGEIRTRCEKCMQERCLQCGGQLTTLRRVLENGEPMGDTIRVCTNKECPMRRNINKLKPEWKQIYEK